MKNIIIAVIFLTAGASYIPSLAQNSVDPLVFGVFPSDSINFSSAAFRNNNTNRFLFAWNWGQNEGWIDSALGINAYHDHAMWFNYGSQLRPWDADMILNIQQYGDHGYAGIGPFNTQCMWYHPELTVDSTAAFQVMTGDPQGAVFGWASKALGNKGTGLNQWRWMLSANTSNWRQRVLWNLWKGTGFAWQHWNVKYKNGVAQILEGGMNDSIDVAPNGKDDTLYQPRNGKRWYLTVQLKATNIPQFNALPDTARILSFTMPYTLYDSLTQSSSAGLIRFDSLPSIAGNATYTIISPRNVGDVRGIARNNVVATAKPTEFVITKAMLAGQNPANGITLSAFLRTDGVTIIGTNTYIDNPLLQPEDTLEARKAQFITKLGIEAFYYPNADIGIDYVRLETPQARKVFFGKQDKELRDSVRHIAANVLMAQTAPAHQPKIYRFYNVEERREQWWGMMRYYNILLDRRAGAEIGSVQNPPKHYLHATAMNEFWQGDNYQTSSDIGTPVIRRAQPFNVSTMGYYRGYEGNTDESYSREQVEHSHYESIMPTYYPNWTRLTWSNFANNNTAWFSGNPITAKFGGLFEVEKLLHNAYYKHPDMIYSSLPWWTNVWMATQYWYRASQNGNPTSVMMGFPGCDRPCIGEEARLEITLPFLLGVKGFSYWRSSPVGASEGKYVPGLTESEDPTWIQSLQQQFATPKAATLSVYAGSDWMKTTESIFAPWANIFNASFHNWSLLGHDTNHIYIGKRSQRTEIYKLNSMIRANESELLSLRLQAWYGKGFVQLYSQTPAQSSTDSLLNHFVSFRQLKSRPLINGQGRVHSNGTPYYENEVSGQDSTFADIMLHKRDSLSLDSVFYLGIQNRRTDPLWHDASYALDEMIFVPTAEWDSLMQNGGVFWKAPNDVRSPAWWKSKYWQRQGCRELRIPFNYTHPDGEPRLLHVQQMGSNGNILDTIIRQNAVLSLLFEPGEGKMLRVTIQPARATIANGDLANSNQCKLVAYPHTRVEGGRLITVRDSMRYHLVYSRGVVGNNRIYYRRSKLYGKSELHTGGIEWEVEQDLTQNGINKLNGRTSYYTSCDAPTLTLRMDTTALTGIAVPVVYVVYSCCDSVSEVKYRIVENMFPANDVSQTPYPARELDSAIGVRYYWNTRLTDMQFLSYSCATSINASAQGNYYAWSDSLLGIVTRWKPAQTTSFAAGGTPRHNVRFLDGISYCQNPSLNTFSRVDLGERTCALTWKESVSPELPADYIGYTRLLHTDTPTVRHYLKKNQVAGFRCRTNGNLPPFDTTIAILNDTYPTQFVGYPMVYCGVETYTPDSSGSQGTRPLATAHWDRVVWEAGGVPDTVYNNNYSYKTHYRGIDAADSTAGVSEMWAVTPTYTVWSNQDYVYRPTIAQGSVRLASDGFTNISDSAVVLNFQSEAPSPSRVWQIECGYWSVIPNNPNIDGYNSNPQLLPYLHLISDGYHPHLSAQPSIKSRAEWNTNRSVYHPEQPTGTTIASSALNFYKQSGDEVRNEPLHYAGYTLTRDNGRVFKTLLSQSKVGDSDILFRTERRVVNGSVRIATDTVYSDWFRVGNTTRLRNFTLGMDNPCVRIEIERRKENGNDNGERYRIPIMTAGNDTAKRRNNFNLLRGGNKFYRLVLINTCGNALRYTEEIQLDGLTSVDREEDNAKAGVQDEAVSIDLKEAVEGRDVLSIQPNPADDNIILRFDGLPDDYEQGDYRYEVGIYSQVGQLMYQGSIRAGDSQRINTTHLSSGVYRVQIKGSRDVISTQVVIVR